MFLHLYKYRLKALIRQKETSFWIFFFPLALATLFSLAFGSINAKTENFNTIPVAVVLDDIESEKPFTTVLESLENDGKDFFSITYTTQKEASSLLDSEDVMGIITVEEGIPSLMVLENGMESSMIKIVLDQYIRTMDLISHAPMDPEIIASITSQAEKEAIKIKDHKLANGTVDNFTDYYYALIAMACLFGSFTGQVCSNQIKADRSTVGMRKTISSAHRIRLILSDIAAALTLHGLSNAILLIYLAYVLKINLGVSLFPAWIIALVGSAIGINTGIVNESIPKLSENGRMGLSIAFSLFSSFLSGLMIGGIKQVIEEHIPIVNRINPATLISNSLHSLNIYNNYDKFFMNVFTMLGICVILCIASYLLTRRASYDSL